MAKDAGKKMDEVSEDVKPVAFEKGETVWFCPVNGEKEFVEIVDLPANGSTKYPCKFKDGTITPVNACYLSKGK